MTLATENAGDIVWPDEEHLFAADNLSSNDRAVSHGSERGTGLDGGTDNHAEGNDNNFGATATEISDANEFWDHDDRTQNNGNLRSTSPEKYPMTEEEADIWRHDKFDLLKIGPPPGLGGKRKGPPAQQGLHQQHQTSRRTRPGGAPTYRVLVVPRPPNTGQMPPGGWPERSFGNYTFPMFSTDDLNEDSKTPWPDEAEVRDEDINRWGWGDEEEASASADASEPAEAPVSNTPASTSESNMPRPGRSSHNRAREPHAPRLSQLEKQTLQQVDQRNADLAAVMTRLRLQELRQQSGQMSQSAAYQHPFGQPRPAARGALGYPSQEQPPGAAVQYQFSNGVLVPSHTVPMPPAAALPSSPAFMRPSMSHMFTQLSQQARPGPLPGIPPPPQDRFVNPLPQAPPSRPLDRSGAGYMASSRKGHQGYAPSSREFPLKPGHLKGSQPSMLAMATAPSLPPAVPFSQVPASLQPPLLPSRPSLPGSESRTVVIGGPTQQAKAAAAAWAAANAKGVPAAAQKPGKRALAIVDPESKQALSVPSSAASGVHLACSHSSSSTPAANADKPGKKLISIVDPSNKLPVQLPSKPLGTSRLVRTNSSTSAISTDSSLPAKRTIAIVDPLSRQPVALQTQAPVTNMQASQSANANSKRAKAPIAIVDPITASEVHLPAVHTSTHKAGLSSAAAQTQGRLIRARKPLAIVDPKAKAGVASAVRSTALPSTVSGLAGATHANTVMLTFVVADGMPVRCSLHLRGEKSQGVTSDAVRVQLTVGAGDHVACSITPSSGLAGDGNQKQELHGSTSQ